MEDLIKALQILLKYDNPKHPTVCEHDTLYILVDPSMVSEEDITKLDKLGVHVDHEYGNSFLSYKYGSA